MNICLYESVTFVRPYVWVMTSLDCDISWSAKETLIKLNKIMFMKRPFHYNDSYISSYLHSANLVSNKLNMSRFMTKPKKWLCAQRRLRSAWAYPPVWSESSLSACRKLGSLATHWAHTEDSDQTGRMPRLIWVFAGRTLILLVLSCRGSNIIMRVSDR